MADVTTSPVAALEPQDKTVLSRGITAAATTVYLASLKKWVNAVETTGGIDTTSGFGLIEDGTGRYEYISFGTASVDATSKETTLTDVRRGLSVTASSYTAGTGMAWDAGAAFKVVDYPILWQKMAMIDKANTFTEDQTIESGNKLLVGGANAYVWTENTGTDLKFKDANNSEKTLSQLAAAGGSDEKVAIDSAATAGYIGAASNDGVLRTSAPLTYTDGGDYITLGVDTVTVPQGGTGLTTLTTAYGVVCAGTTATGALQNAGAGTSGQVLTSNGASSLPSFQAAAHNYDAVKISIADSTAVGASSTAQNNMDVTYDITADTWLQGEAYKLYAVVEYDMVNTGGTDELYLAVRLDTTDVIVFNSTQKLTVESTDIRVIVEATIVLRSAPGATATVAGTGMRLPQITTDGVMCKYGTATVDTTQDLTLQMSAQFAASHASNNCKLIDFIVTKLKV